MLSVSQYGLIQGGPSSGNQQQHWLFDDLPQIERDSANGTHDANGKQKKTASPKRRHLLLLPQANQQPADFLYGYNAEAVINPSEQLHRADGRSNDAQL